MYEYLYIQVVPAPPPPGNAGMGSLKDMWGAPPPLCKVCNGRDVFFYYYYSWHIAHCTFCVLFLWPSRVDSLFSCWCPESA